VYKLFLILILICPSFFSAQVSEEWRAHYIGPGTGDFMHSMCIDSIGSVYITGQSNVNNSSDFATVKYSTTGVQLWVARFEGMPNRGAIPFSVAADKFGNAYVTGIAPVSSNGPSKFTTVKYNQSGEQCWVRIFYGQYYYSADAGLSITTDDSANVYVTGISFSTNSGADYTTIKYDSSGSQKWVAYYDGGIGQDWARYVKVDYFGNIYVTGSSRYHGDTTNYDIATIKYNSLGIQQWAARYNGPGNGGDSANGLILDNQGNIYVTGSSWGGDSTGYDYVTIKYNGVGVQQWARRYNRTANSMDIAHSLAVDDSGNVYVTGETYYIDSTHYATIKYSPSGEQLWVVFYIYQYGEHGYSIALDKQGGVYVTGESWGGLFGTKYDFATVKYSAAGIQQWVIRTSGPDDEVPGQVAVDSLGNVYVAGGDGHYLTIKYNQVTGINPVSSEIAKEYKLYQNYPNPFNPVTKIKFSIPPSRGARGVIVKLTIYDILGREVANLIPPLRGGQEGLQPGTYSVTWDASNFPSGVYYYELRAGNYSETKKMVLVK
jgi:hypothetical protein